MILYLYAREGSLNLANIGNVYQKEYNQQDMLQVFKMEMQNYKLVTRIIVDENAFVSSSWESAASLMKELWSIPILILIDAPEKEQLYDKLEFYDTLNLRMSKDPIGDIKKWLANELVYVPPKQAPLTFKQEIMGYIKKYQYVLIAYSCVMLILIIILCGLLIRESRRHTEYIVYTPVERMNSKSSMLIFRKFMTENESIGVKPQETESELIMIQSHKRSTEEQQPDENDTEAPTEEVTTEGTKEDSDTEELQIIQ